MNDDDIVGPGRPPRKNRFQKGQSGNPAGRPPGRPNRKTIDKLYNELFFDCEVTVNGREGGAQDQPLRRRFDALGAESFSRRSRRYRETFRSD